MPMWIPRRRAASRHGLLARDDLQNDGLTDRQIRTRVRAGVLEEVLPSVYRVGGVPETYEQRLLAAQMWAGEGAVVSHRAAGALWELDGVPTGHVEVSSSHHLEHPDITVHRRWNLEPSDVSVKRGILVTAPTRTLLDLGAVLTFEELERALEDALRRRLTYLDLLLTRFDRWARRGRHGTSRWRQVLEKRDPALRPTESDFETKLFQLCRRAVLPTPIRQHRILNDDGLIGRADFAYPEGLIAIEAESLRFHLGRRAFEKDLRRTNRLQTAGWIVLRFSYLDVVTRPDEVASEIRSALILRGVLAA